MDVKGKRSKHCSKKIIPTCQLTFQFAAFFFQQVSQINLVVSRKYQKTELFCTVLIYVTFLRKHKRQSHVCRLPQTRL